jgi:nitrite reductase/ring-hydroxylating ferredoxin subunit
MTSIRLCGATELAPGDARRFPVAGAEPVALFNVEGTLYATADTCSHQRASLSQGEVEGDEVICPLHFQVFHIPTGEAREGITTKPIETFPLSVVEGDVYLELP